MSDAPRLDVTLFRALHLATRQVTAGVSQQLQTAAGVSLPEYEILTTLAQSPENRARPREIGDMLAWEKSRTSHQVTRMEKRGLLKRIDCDADLRGTWVSLTVAGAEAVRAAEPAYIAAIVAQLGDIAPVHQRELLAQQLVAIGRSASPTTCQGEVAALEASLEANPTAL